MSISLIIIPLSGFTRRNAERWPLCCVCLPLAVTVGTQPKMLVLFILLQHDDVDIVSTTAIMSVQTASLDIFIFFFIVTDRKYIHKWQFISNMWFNKGYLVQHDDTHMVSVSLNHFSISNAGMRLKNVSQSRLWVQWLCREAAERWQSGDLSHWTPSWSLGGDPRSDAHTTHPLLKGSPPPDQD